jgi:hypothetical protein
MDEPTFDRLTRSLTLAGSRRGALGGLLIGMLSLVGTQTEHVAAKKKPCPPCKKRKKGKCRGTLPNGTACTGGACQGGRCIAATPGPCDGLANDALCSGGTGRCLNGSCNPPPPCKAVAGTCTIGSDCCTGTCRDADGSCRGFAPDNAACRADADCGSGLCIGYRCAPNSCPAGADACKAPATCGIGGQCFQPKPDDGPFGPTRCGTVAPASCGCPSTAACVEAFGRGASCVIITGNRCTCGVGSTHTTFCILPA